LGDPGCEEHVCSSLLERLEPANGFADVGTVVEIDLGSCGEHEGEAEGALRFGCGTNPFRRVFEVVDGMVRVSGSVFDGAANRTGFFGEPNGLRAGFGSGAKSVLEVGT